MVLKNLGTEVRFIFDNMISSESACGKKNDRG